MEDDGVSSPSTSPLEFRGAIDELLKFTLDGSLGIDLPLPHHFCSRLLLTTIETPCPLFKRLGLALCDLLDSTAHSQGCKHLTDLSNILKTVEFELHVQEPFFAQLKDGIKTVEGRCAIGDYNRIKPGSVIVFNKCLLVQVQQVRKYSSFLEMLEAETLPKVLPGVQTIKQGVQVYRKFYSEEKENKNGVLGIHVAKPALQLYIPLARILSEMGCEGIHSLLGL